MYALVCHADTPANRVSAVRVECTADDANEVLLTFVVEGCEALVVPEWSSPARTDELWRTTCFELFWQAAGGQAYLEVNLSPSGRWAAYAFDDYRAGMRDHAMDVDPHVEIMERGERFVVDADVNSATFPDKASRIGLSAVIEETDGTKSYWALRHPPGAPDFHHPDCFALELPALARP